MVKRWRKDVMRVHDAPCHPCAASVAAAESGRSCSQHARHADMIRTATAPTVDPENVFHNDMWRLERWWPDALRVCGRRGGKTIHARFRCLARRALSTSFMDLEMRTWALLSACFLVVLPSAAHADSDGYYCVGPGYVAWETRFDEDGKGHELHIVRVSAARGIVRFAPIALDDFQVHGMTCGPDTVDLHAWTARYSVQITDSAQTSVSRIEAIYDPGEVSNGNLGHWAQPGIIVLESDGGEGEFLLVINRTSRPVEGGIERFTFTSIVRRSAPGAGGSIVQSLEIFRGVFFESVH